MRSEISHGNEPYFLFHSAGLRRVSNPSQHLPQVRCTGLFRPQVQCIPSLYCPIANSISTSTETTTSIGWLIKSSRHWQQHSQTALELSPTLVAQGVSARFTKLILEALLPQEKLKEWEKFICASATCLRKLQIPRIYNTHLNAVFMYKKMSAVWSPKRAVMNDRSNRALAVWYPSEAVTSSPCAP